MSARGRGRDGARGSRAAPAGAWIALGLLLGALACDSLPAPPGKPSEADRHVASADVVDFESLFATHCSGCHGADGRLGPARALRDPLYLAIVPKPVLEQTIRAGVPGTPMPAFGRSAGGPLSDAQLSALVEGMQRSWGGDVHGELPAYAGTAPGDPGRGRAAFGVFCARCHGADGRGAGAAGGSVVDSAYLGLVSDQGLRSSVLVGRVDLGAPNWRSDVEGRPMTEGEIADVVAWLVAQRPRFPGQPYPEPPPAPAGRAGFQPSPEGDRR